MSSSDVPDSVGRNIASWTQANAEYTDGAAADAWAQDEITFGMLGIPDSELGVIGDVRGLDVVELGCGTAYFSAWLAKAGARPVGVDPTPAQLATARRMQQQTGIDFPLVEAPAERVPLPDSSFDLAVSEYGASLWADPERWVAEAARLLRPGARLVFLTNSPLAILCSPEREEEPIQENLLRPQFGMYRVEWPDEEGVEYHLSHSDWIRVLRAKGFEIEGLWELQAPEGWQPHSYYGWLTAEWAQQWPAEEIWVAGKRG
jgi:SAM-dependent methyltransferase